MIVPVTNGAHKDVDDLYGDHFAVALAQAMTRLECAPYWHQGEKAPARLTRAAELVRLSRVQLHDSQHATVHGATRAYDLTGYHCTCPQSQKGPSMWCVHSVAVKLARTLADQGPPTTRATAADQDDDALGNGYPVDDETLPLPLPPTTVDERYRAAIVDLKAVTQHLNEEPPMTEDAAAYIPEPAAHESVSTAPATPKNGVSVLAPMTHPAHALESALQAWTEQRAVVKRFLQQELTPNVDFYTLRIGGRDSKPSLSKAGSEKILGWMQLQASFAPDLGTWEMLGKPQDLVCFVCTLRTRSGEIVGEGRGARSVKKDGGDINKAIKMAEKSAQVSAVLRTGALSDVFTVDLEDMQDTPAEPKPQPNRITPSQDMRARIWALVQAQAPHLKGRDEVAAWVKAETQLELHPDNYVNIVKSLEK